MTLVFTNGNEFQTPISPSAFKILKLPKTIRGLNVMKKLLKTKAVDLFIDFLD